MGEVLDQRLSGYQVADWHEQNCGGGVLAFLHAVAASALAGWVVDLVAAEGAALSWQKDDRGDCELIYRYRGCVLRAVSATHFVDTVRSGRLG